MNALSGALVFGILALNFVISWWNAWLVGRVWVIRSDLSGWRQFVLYSTAIMSVCGFTWVFIFALGGIAYSLRHDVEFLAGFGLTQLEGLFNLGYVVIGPVVVVTGVVITIDAVVHAIRTKRAADAGIALYDVGASIYNAAQLFEYLPEALQSSRNLFVPDQGNDDYGGDLEDMIGRAVLRIILLILFLALLGGLLLTATIIKQTAHNHSYEYA